jgi:hypothetical protein
MKRKTKVVKPPLVRAKPKVGVAVALPKGTVPVLALHLDKNVLNVVPVPKEAVKKPQTWLEWLGFPADGWSEK